MTHEFTDANFKGQLAEGMPVVVDLWAPWCGPCRMMAPIIDELANEYEGRVLIGKMNVDENSELAEQYGVMSIPTMLFFKNGELVNRHVGACRKPDLQKLIDEML